MKLGSDSSTSSTSSTTDASRIWNSSNGTYHSRSQWVWGTTKNRVPASIATARAYLRSAARTAASIPSLPTRLPNAPTSGRTAATPILPWAPIASTRTSDWSAARPEGV